MTRLFLEEPPWPWLAKPIVSSGYPLTATLVFFHWSPRKGTKENSCNWWRPSYGDHLEDGKWTTIWSWHINNDISTLVKDNVVLNCRPPQAMDCGLVNVRVPWSLVQAFYLTSHFNSIQIRLEYGLSRQSCHWHLPKFLALTSFSSSSLRSSIHWHTPLRHHGSLSSLRSVLPLLEVASSFFLVTSPSSPDELSWTFSLNSNEIGLSRNYLGKGSTLFIFLTRNFTKKKKKFASFLWRWLVRLPLF